MQKTAITIIALLILALAVTSSWAEDNFVWPVSGNVIKHFDPDEHRGIDIAANADDNVLSSQDGVVNWIGRTPRGEPCISIDHPNGLTSTYLPVRATVSKGQPVKAGDIIGTLSSEIDKSSAVEHLHFGLFDTSTRDNKAYVNPEDYLPQVANAVEPLDGDNRTEQAPVSRSEGEPEVQLVSNPVEEIQDVPQTHEARVGATPATIIEEPSSRQVAHNSPLTAASNAKSTVEIETVALESNADAVTVAGAQIAANTKPATPMKLVGITPPVNVEPTTSMKQATSMRRPASIKPAVGYEIGSQENMRPVAPQSSNPSLSSAKVSKSYGITNDIATGKRYIEKEASTLKLSSRFSIASLAKSKSKSLFFTITALLLVIIASVVVSALLARRMSRARETLIINPSAIGSSLSC